MPYAQRVIGVVVCSVSVALLPLRVTAGSAADTLPRATVVAPHGLTTYQVRDRDGRLVRVRVPMMTAPGLKVSNRARGTVRATIRAIHRTTRQVIVRTHAGQTLRLDVPPSLLRSMRVGDQFTLQVARRSAR